MIHAALFFMYLTPLVIVAVIVGCVALARAAAKGDEQIELDEPTVTGAPAGQYQITPESWRGHHE